MKKWIIRIISLCFLLSPLASLAQDVAATSPAVVPQVGMSSQEWMLLIMMGLVIFVAVLVLIVSISVLSVMNAIMLNVNKQTDAPRESLLMTWWKNLDRKWTNAIPLEKEDTMLLDHNYDGIKELNNHLPPWWLYLFYITIVFAGIYMLNYHVFGWQPLSAKEYETEMAVAAKEVEAYKKLYAKSIDENNVKATTDAGELAKGKEVFLKECKACHGEKGEGIIGPNLTDEYWIYKGSINDIFKTIKYGAKNGMIAWEKKLTPDVMRNVSSYILTLQGTKPANAKAPQGEKYVPEKK